MAFNLLLEELHLVSDFVNSYAVLVYFVCRLKAKASRPPDQQGGCLASEDSLTSLASNMSDKEVFCFFLSQPMEC